MKKIYLSLIAIVFATNFSYAQWIGAPGDIHYNTGNVGIGTATPGFQLELRNGSGLAVITSNAQIVLSDIVNNMKLRMDNSSNLQITNAATSPLVSFMQGGNVGIGTTSPAEQIEVYGSSPIAYLHDNGGGSPALKFENSNDIWATGFSANNADYAIKSLATGTVGLIIKSSTGKVGIGTTTPDEMLSVVGTIHSKEVKVNLTGLPDYVFKPTYHLLTLPEVKTYIDQNHHLPDVPSAAEVEKNGLNLGEMDKVLTKKVEELTLYMIEKDKQVTTLQDEVNQLKHQVKTLLKPKK